MCNISYNQNCNQGSEEDNLKLSQRQKEIIDVVKEYEPITSDEIGGKLGVAKSTIRNDLAVLSMLEILEAKPNVGYYYNYNFTQSEKKNTIKNKKVSEVMGVAVMAKSTESYAEVLSKLFIYDVGTIFIVNEDGELVGVTSRKDMLKLSQANKENLPIALAMTRVPNIITIEEDDLVSDALRKIILHEIDCLPVIKEKDGKKTVVGKISKTTLIKILLEILEG